MYRAAWVLPIIGPPLRAGLVAVEGDRIAGVAGDARRDGPAPSWLTRPAEIVDLGERAILPGLVNAHTHLELSWMRDRVPPAGSLPVWAEQLMDLRASRGGDPVPPIHDAIGEARAAGTSLVGDVTNTLAAWRPLAQSRIAGAVFRELLGFNAPDAEQRVAAAWAEIADLPPSPRLRATVVPHAPFSVAPALFRAIAATAGDRPLSVHLGESAEEIQFLRDGTGAWRDLLGRLGVWTDSWRPPGCGPVEYLDALGLVGARLLAVHGTHLTDSELRRLAAAGSTVVTCPRSNRWVGEGSPPVARFYASGVRVAIGTDSLASVGDLNLFAELAEVRRLAPGVPAARLLESATTCGAAALGFGAEFGTLEAGKRADMIAVRIPAGVEDVEEYLVTARLEPGAIEWLS